jgi:RNA recognition motif-containing protein
MIGTTQPNKQQETLMSKNLYVGNLAWSTTENDIRNAFAAHGEVISVKLIEDRETGRPRGFGFVEMDDAGADAVIAEFDGKDLDGRNIKVNIAKPREERPRW